MLAAQRGYADIVAALLADKRVEPNLKDDTGRTALMYATHIGKLEIVKLLLGNENLLNRTLKDIISPDSTHTLNKELESNPFLLAQLILHASQIWEQLKSPEKMGLTDEQHTALLQNILNPDPEHPLRTILLRKKSDGSFFKSESSFIFDEMVALAHQNMPPATDAPEGNVETPCASANIAA